MITYNKHCLASIFNSIVSSVLSHWVLPHYAVVSAPFEELRSRNKLFFSISPLSIALTWAAALAPDSSSFPMRAIVRCATCTLHIRSLAWSWHTHDKHICIPQQEKFMALTRRQGGSKWKVAVRLNLKAAVMVAKASLSSFSVSFASSALKL